MWSGLGNCIVCYMVMNVLEDHSGPAIYIYIYIYIYVILHRILN